MIGFYCHLVENQSYTYVTGTVSGTCQTVSDTAGVEVSLLAQLCCQPAASQLILLLR